MFKEDNVLKQSSPVIEVEYCKSKFLTRSVKLIPAKEDNILKQSSPVIEGEYCKNEHPMSHLQVKLL